jgi:hypothetical protein
MNTNEPMIVNCEDRGRIFADGTEQDWAALEVHAANCEICAGEIRAWLSLSAAAQELRDYGETPGLWLKIRKELADQAEKNQRSSQRWGWLRFWQTTPDQRHLGWQTVLAGAFAIVLAVSLAWVYVHRSGSTNSPVASSSPLLKDSALAEVERTEKAYEHAIEKLAQEAKPQLENPATPLLTSYHEKLLVIDSAIDDLRAQAGMNPSNAHLRRQLLAMYEEKQQTLEDVLEAKPQ